MRSTDLHWLPRDAEWDQLLAQCGNDPSPGAWERLCRLSLAPLDLIDTGRLDRRMLACSADRHRPGWRRNRFGSRYRFLYR